MASERYISHAAAPSTTFRQHRTVLSETLLKYKIDTVYGHWRTTADVLPACAVYPSGLVCISILHAPGDDPHHYEKASERWSPIQSVEKILISVMSMLAEPNDESPANIEAAKMWRERRSEFEKTVREGVRRSLGM